jgi:hypothetical protein
MFVIRFAMPKGEVFVCSGSKDALVEFENNVSATPVQEEQRIHGAMAAIESLAIEFKPIAQI